MTMNLNDINKNMPDWIKEVASKKHFRFGVGYKGWKWEDNSGTRDYINYTLNFYYPNGFKRQCSILVSKDLFIYQYFELDETAKIPALKLEEDTVVKLRLMYLIYYAYHWVESTPEFDPKVSAKYLNTDIVVLVDTSGKITKQFWNK